ncbi:MAG: hypothetical protein KKD35_07785 [Elusimicrobia bacterium]|nr:hypothetical protein [Elusimicrobiota bacterium]
MNKQFKKIAALVRRFEIRSIKIVLIFLERYYFAGLESFRQSSTSSSIFAVPAHITVSAPPQ